LIVFKNEQTNVMLRNAVLVAAVVWIVVLGACGPSDLPAVSTPDPSLDEGERAVIIAVLDDFLRPQRDKEIRQSRGNDPASSPTPARFLAFDVTVPVCTAQPMLSGDKLPGCIFPDWLGYMKPVAPGLGRAQLSMFERRNATPIPIRGDLGNDVSYIPTTIERFQELTAFLRQSSVIGSSVVAFSAPVYPKGGHALIAYRTLYSGVGFVALQRSQGKWKVSAIAGSTE
jgi:hypothetical protein